MMRIVLATLLVAGSVMAQTKNYSGLENRNLRLDVVPADILLNLTMGGDCKGSVTQVRVTDDTETRLTLTVTTKDFGGCVLTAALVDDGRTQFKGFVPGVQTIPPGSDPSTLTFTFEIDRGSQPVNQPITVPKVYFTFGKEANASKYYRAAYVLNKKFLIPPGSADIVTEVTLIPLGSAASIPRTTTRPATVALPRIQIYQKLEKVSPNINVINTKSLYLKGMETSKLNIDRSATPTGTGTGAGTVKVAAPRTAVAKPIFMERAARFDRVLQPASPTPPPPPDPNPQGPSDRAIPLFESLVTDYDFEYPFEVTNIRLDVYPDKNKGSGVFYFIPSAYSLLFEKDRGLQFVIDYGTATSGDTGQTVRMAGKLTAGISKKEIDVVKELVKAYVRTNPQLGFPARCEFRALQIEGSPTVTFDTDLRQYNISNQTVNATSLSEPVDVSWRTDQANATDISNSLKANVGIIGTMTLKPQGGTLSEQTIPVRIRLADERTIGRFTLSPGWRTQTWRNISPYPIKLKNLHVLWVNGNTPAVYTWQLGDKDIPAGSQVKFQGDALPQWLDDEQYARYWLEYEIENCESCHDSVIRSVIHSTVQAQSQQIKFKLLTFFQEFHLSAMVINVRTKQADATGGTVQTLPAIEVTRDAGDYLSAKIYVPPGGTPDFEFQVQIIQEDGKAYESEWQQRSSLLVPIGSSQIRQFFPQVTP